MTSNELRCLDLAVRNSPRQLQREFYAQRTLVVARELIGKHLVRVYRGRQLVGRIVETEAYQGPQDLAAHSARGQNARNAVLFGPPGFSYVYLIYGMWHCLNVVTREQGVPHAVLIRALEPIAPSDARTWGPGLLCKSMRIDRRLNGVDLCGSVDRSALWIETPTEDVPSRVARATRIGVDYAGTWAAKHWRFFDIGSSYVSTVSTAARRAWP